MNPPTALNRTLLALIGLVLLAAGAGAVAAGLGLLPTTVGFGPSTALLAEGTAWADWAPTAAIAGAVVIGLLALAWLLTQLRPQRSGGPWRTDGALGATTLRLTDAAVAVAEDVRGYPGVTDASAVLVGPRARPALRLLVDLRPGTGTGALKQRVDAHALPRLRAALELRSLSTELLVRPGSGPTGRRDLR
jgi:hypothetical protein